MGEGLKQYAVRGSYWTFWNTDKVVCKECGGSFHPERPVYKYPDGTFQCDFCYCKEHKALYSELQIYANPLHLNERRKK